MERSSFHQTEGPGRFFLLWLIIILGGSLAGLAPLRSVDSGLPNRGWEPVLIKGAHLPAFWGARLEDIVVVAYGNAGWSPIPFQIDEVDAVGRIVAHEDGILDANDELVFLAEDLGASAPLAAEGGPFDPTTHPRYQVRVTDPLAPGQPAWAYIYRGALPITGSGSDAVRFEEPARRIVAERYVGVIHPQAGLQYLAMNGSATDLLDRNKFVIRWGQLAITEQDLELTLLPVKDGTVRVVLELQVFPSETGETVPFYELRMLAYPAQLQLQVAVDLSEVLPARFPVSNLRFSTDLNANAVGMTYYNANVMQGVTIDGMPDIVDVQPLSRWHQISGPTGTLIFWGDPSPIGGIQTNYFKDDATLEPEDTGDQKSYGDFGFETRGFINTRFDFQSRFLVLPPDQPNVGATYGAFFEHPLQLSVEYQNGQPAETPTRVIERTPTVELTPSLTSSVTQTPTETRAWSPTYTRVPTRPVVPSPTMTPTPSPTAIPTPTTTATSTPLPAFSPTPTFPAPGTATATIPVAPHSPTPTAPTPITGTPIGTQTPTVTSGPTPADITPTTTRSATASPVSQSRYHFLPLIIHASATKLD